ncbi:right-handed parallel beta-helix repeat-containing protein [Herminiimonas arsenitoxidans]|uniref:right-handed parallel beta-helix repeat-containing protein n=1 Tax=Herminiimonas arsenitoxidans TaxID=1809410 RepID=UPI000970558D|nr:right-handed parallel beta-helix repeat-containing protein [Herminiimonas arsenitoxidans]
MKKIINALFLLLLCINVSSYAATRNVCASGATYTTIAAAITAASNGDEIVICSGTYNESLPFSQSNLTIRSSTGNRSDVKISSSGPVFTIAGQSATFKNLTITATGSGKTAIVNDYNNGIGTHTFENLAITANGTGIDLQTGGPHTFKNLNITSSTGSGIVLEYNADAAHIFDTVTVNSSDDGIAVARGVGSMKTINVSSTNGIGISVGSKYSAVFQDITVASKKDAFQMVYVENARTHSFTNMTATSQSGKGIYITLSGKLTFNNVVVTANGGNGIELTSNADGAHTFNTVTVTSSGDGITADRGIVSMQSVAVTAGGAGIVVYGVSSIKNVNVSSQDIALDIGTPSGITLDGVLAKSAKKTAINLRYGAAVVHTLKNITVNGADKDGIHVESSSQVVADNICVNAAAGYGAYFSYNAKNVSLQNSILKGSGDYRLNLESEPSSANHINNSCFYNDASAKKCASSASSAQDFSGNYWASGCSNNNVPQTSPLPNCPLVANNCYVGIPTNAAVGGFNAFESATAAGAIAGVIKTKIAGNVIVLDAIALNTAKTAVESGFSGDVKVELLGNVGTGVTLDAVNCPATSTLLTSQVMTFAAASAGRQSVAIAAVPNVYRDVRVRFTYPATGTATSVACSSDNFAIRPDKFIGVSVTDNDWQTAGVTRTLANNAVAGGNVHKAGQPFRLSATAVNAAAAQTTTSNYTGSPLATVACTLPTPTCVNGALTAVPTTWSGSGMTTTSAAMYSEVGSFNLVLTDQVFANVDVKPGDSTVDEYTISSAPVLVGRFVPDHFALTVNTVPEFRTFNAACTGARSFTYIGQPFRYRTLPVITITAQNVANATTTNYRDALWTLTEGGVAQTYTSDPTTLPVLDYVGSPITLFKGNGTGTITANAADELTFRRDATTPRAAFNANISLTVTARETIANHGDIVSIPISNPAPIFSNIAFDSGNQFRYGRMRIDNANGSELLNLSLPIRTDFWNGTNFVVNAADNCTTVAAANVAFRAYAGGINASNMPVATHVASGSTLQLGVGRIVLTRPAPAPASNGSVDVCVDLGADTAPPAGIACTAVTSAAQPWLQGRWSQILFDDDPGARATFGVYKSGPVIYMREVY